nr:C1 family peptidase [Collinsella urealyticum]
MQDLARTFSTDRANRIARNAVTTTGIVGAARDQRAVRSYTDTYGIELAAARTVTDQMQSGRCWMFSTLNVIRAKTMDILDLDDFEFSQAYLTFYEKLEKSNAFLDRIIETAELPPTDRIVNHLTMHAASDGGQFMFCASLVEKWGLVPKEIMPETACSRDTKAMNEVLGELLLHDAAQLRVWYREGVSKEELCERKDEMLKAVHRVLSCCLGEPPVTFDVLMRVGPAAQVPAHRLEIDARRDRRLLSEHGITPQEFACRYAQFDASSYIELSSLPGETRPFSHLYSFRWFDPVIGGRPVKYLNVEMSRLEEAAIASLRGSTPVYMMCDVAKRSLRYAADHSGVLALDCMDLEGLFDIDLSMSRAAALDLNAMGMSHCMVFQGVQLDGDGRPHAWRVENSHGAAENKNGYYIMSGDWHRAYGGVVVVERQFVPEDLVTLWDTLPVEQVDPWTGFINYRPW